MKLRRRKTPKVTYQTKAIIHDHDYSDVFDDAHMEKFIEQKREQKDYENLRNRFRYIKRLIKAKRFADARYELVAIDHPKADEWLEKLNQLDPDYSETTIILFKHLLIAYILIVLGGMLLVGFGQLEVNANTIIGMLVLMILLLFVSIWTRLR